MIDSQARVRWLAAVLVLIVLIIGPVTAGVVFPDEDAATVDVKICDNREEPQEGCADEEVKAPAIVLVSPVGRSRCISEGEGCPSLDRGVVKVPMPAAEKDYVGALTQAYPELTALEDDSTKVVRTVTVTSFSGKSAVIAGSLLLIGTLLAIAVLAGRHPRRLFPVTAPQDPPPVPRPTPPWQPVRDQEPVRRTAPVLALADLPGVRDVVREHGTTAKARSHVGRTGGYVAVGDVLVWALPNETTDGFAAFPDDDVRVTVPTLDGGSLS